MFIELSNYKRITTVVFWTALAIYLLLKNFFKSVPDTVLDFLTIIFLLAMVILSIIRSIAHIRIDQLFYKRPWWISNMYFVGSVALFAIYFEIIEDVPKVISTNFYISIVVLIGVFIMTRMRIQK